MCLNSNAHPKIIGEKFDQIGNKTECALLEMAYKYGYNYIDVRKKENVVKTIPFSSARKRMSTVVKKPNGKLAVYTKGAGDMILGLCSQYHGPNGQLMDIDVEFQNQLNQTMKEFAT